MTNTQKIKMALVIANMKEAELARKLGTTPQAFNQRMKTDKFSTDELEKIAAALGAVYTSSFTFPNGEKV